MPSLGVISRNVRDARFCFLARRSRVHGPRRCGRTTSIHPALSIRPCNVHSQLTVATGVPSPEIPEERRSRSFVGYYPNEEDIMDREHVKGTADKAKGGIKEGAGKLTGDNSLETEGKIDKAKGSAHNAAGEVKDAARDAADAVRK